MVRASEISEDKKETTKKKTPPKKKIVVTGVWPCKINGCNKQFAREADLKRHQRTTKLHSMPGFACPQCDATFTRTDALRRHQKSRHNGIVIESSDQEMKEDEGENTQPGSRSGTPSSNGKDRTPSSNATPQIIQSQPGSVGGPSSYYRQHTAMSTPFIPRPQPPIEAQYTQVGIPTSASRMNAAASWGYPYPWPESLAHHMGPISYHPLPGHIYFPMSPHYRPIDPNAHPRPEVISNPRSVTNIHSPSSTNDLSRTGTPHSSSHTVTGAKSTSGSPDRNNKSNFSDLGVIDPSLDSSSNSAHPDSEELTEEQLMEITQAAIQVVAAQLEAERRKSSTPNEIDHDGVASQTSLSRHQSEGEADKDASEPTDQTQTVSSHISSLENGLHGYGPQLDRPEPMEHMLTEDGEPMLNPAELLTQESLASPPPS